MKKTIVIVSVLCFMAVSCSKVEPEVILQKQSEDVSMGQVTFGLDTGAGAEYYTKATSDGTEDQVNSLKLLVFTSSGDLVKAGSSTSSSITMQLPVGVPGYTVYAVVNGKASLDDVGKESELLAKVSYLSDNTLSNFEMIGALKEQTFSTGTKVTVPVSRFVSKVEIDKVVTDFTSATLAAQKFVLKSIYLINANGSCPYSQTPTSGETWYNKMKDEKGDCKALISTENDLNKEIDKDNPYTTPHYFYTYANPTLKANDSHAETFCPRLTRLVVEATLGGVTYYYPISIKNEMGTAYLDCNNLYKVTTLRIKGPGSPSPDLDLDWKNVTAEVSVTSWQYGFETEYNM